MSNNMLDILNKTISYLENKKVKKSRFEAEKIISISLNIDRLEIYTNFDKELSLIEINEIKKNLKKYTSIDKEESFLEESVKDYIEKTRKYLENKKVEEANILTNIIFSKLLNVDIGMLFTKYTQKIDENTKMKIREILKMIVNNKMPIQYIFNEQIFYGHKFYVDKNVLIPRLDTEIVVEKALELIYNIKNPKVLDLCCGSGAIGIVIALENNNSVVLASDISEKAIKVSNLNKDNLKVKNIKFIKSNLFENIKFDKFDIIVSNPPYISEEETELMSLSTIVHEPREALYAKNSGLYFYEIISKEASKYLNDNGILLFEIGYKQAEDVKNILISNNFVNIFIGKDLTGNDRYIYAMRGKNESK